MCPSHQFPEAKQAIDWLGHGLKYAHVFGEARAAMEVNSDAEAQLGCNEPAVELFKI